MNAYNGMFKVVNRDWQQSLPEIYPTFVEAFDAQQEWDTMAVIEEINGDTVNVVWSPDYDNYVANVFVV